MRKNKHQRVTVFHYAMTRDLNKPGTSCIAHQYKLSTRGRGKQVWNVLYNDESTLLTEAVVLTMLKPFKYVVTDAKHCKPSPLAFYI
jgi:hypothetical protein